VASLLGRMVGKPGEEVAAGRAAVLDALRDAMGGFLSADLEELIPQGGSTGSSTPGKARTVCKAVLHVAQRD